MKKLASLILLCALLFTGCVPFATRIHGGKITHGQTILQQSQDPKQPSTLNQERDEQIVLPAGSLLMVGTNSFRVSSNTTYYVHDKINSTLGAANKNTLQETAAKLASLSWLTYLGAALVIFGIASAVYPPLKLIVGSVTTSAACAAVGVGFIALPSVLVSISPVAILIIGLAALGLWWFSHHHASISAELKTLKNFVISPETPTQPAPPPDSPQSPK